MIATRDRHEVASETRTYQLLIEVARPVRVDVGALGAVTFDAGQYVYTGSAIRSLEARIARHLSANKRMHWHVDLLLGAAGVRVVGVRRLAGPECAVNAATCGRIPVAGFGASDCDAGCGAHLKRLSRPASSRRWSAPCAEGPRRSDDGSGAQHRRA